MKNLIILIALGAGYMSNTLQLLVEPMLTMLLPIFGIAAVAAAINAAAQLYKQSRRDRAIADQEIAF